MIRKPMNWENVQEFSERKTLPLGAYVCKVKQAKVLDNSYGSQLAILFDISEGEHSGFYAQDFAANTMENKKWKGVLRVWLPKDDGSDKDEITKRVLKGMTNAFEQSNPGYTWNWNENSLVDKAIGVLFRNEEWDYNGKHGWAVRPFKALSVAAVRDGNYTLPEGKPLNSKASASATVPPANVPAGYAGFTEVEDEDLPFD